MVSCKSSTKYHKNTFFNTQTHILTQKTLPECTDTRRDVYLQCHVFIYFSKRYLSLLERSSDNRLPFDRKKKCTQSHCHVTRKRWDRYSINVEHLFRYREANWDYFIYSMGDIRVLLNCRDSEILNWQDFEPPVAYHSKLFGVEIN